MSNDNVTGDPIVRALGDLDRYLADNDRRFEFNVAAGLAELKQRIAAEPPLDHRPVQVPGKPPATRSAPKTADPTPEEREQAIFDEYVRSREDDSDFVELVRVMSGKLRRDIVAALVSGARCVHDLVDALGVEQPVVSQHLRILKSAGAVGGERRGREVFYFLVEDPEVMSLAEQIARARPPIPLSETDRHHALGIADQSK